MNDIPVPPGRSRSALAPRIAASIHVVRGREVMLDFELAEFYGVETKRLNQQRTRNPERFPDECALELTADELMWLHSATTSKYRRTDLLPIAYTDVGCYMAMTVLSTPRAIAVSFEVIQAFIDRRLRPTEPALDTLPRLVEQLQLFGERIERLEHAVERSNVAQYGLGQLQLRATEGLRVALEMHDAAAAAEHRQLVDLLMHLIEQCNTLADQTGEEFEENMRKLCKWIRDRLDNIRIARGPSH